MYSNITTKSNLILLREVNNKFTKIKFKPTLYNKVIKNKDDIINQHGILGEDLKPRTFDSIWDMRQAKKIKKYFGDIKVESLFLTDRYEQSEYDVMTIQDLTIFYLDIELDYDPLVFPEPEFAEYPINAITIYNSKQQKYIIWGLEYDGCNKFKPTEDDDYTGFNTESELLHNFISY